MLLYWYKERSLLIHGKGLHLLRSKQEHVRSSTTNAYAFLQSVFFYGQSPIRFFYFSRYLTLNEEQIIAHSCAKPRTYGVMLILIFYGMCGRVVF